MAAKLVDYYRIVQPTAATATVTDNQLLSPGYASSTNYNWYHKIIQGSASRQARYNEYNAMDNDVEIARALDTIAEAMVPKNNKTGMAIDIEMVTDEGQDLDDSLVITLKAAVRHWSELHGFEANRLFKLVRNMIKYGDCFFKKSSNFKKWEWIPSSHIMGAVVHVDDVTKVVAYQIKSNTKSTSAANYSNSTYRLIDNDKDFDLIPADQMVVFSINDDMSDEAPFGESVLRTVYKTHKQKELIEDAMIIYRIQRAPEKRVWYIDVGKMHPSRVKTYLETVKNESKQKSVPSHGMNGKNTVDAVYNPACLILDTLIPLLDGRTLSLSDIIEEHNDGKELWGYSVNPETGAFAPGLISWAGVTRKDAQVIKLTFDNGKTLTCTPDHKIPVQGKGFVEAKDLSLDDSLFPFNMMFEAMPNSKNKGTYPKIYDTSLGDWAFVHRLVARYESIDIGSFVFDKDYEGRELNTVHHKNYNRYDNTPGNLVWMNSQDHVLYHSVGGQNKPMRDAAAARINRLKTDEEYRKQYSEICRRAWYNSEKLNNPEHIAALCARIAGLGTPFKNQVIGFDDLCMDRCIQVLSTNLMMNLDEFMELLDNDMQFTDRYWELNQPIDGYQHKLTGNINKLVLHKCLKKYGYDGFRDFKNSLIVDKFNRYKHPDSDFEIIKKLVSELSIRPVHICSQFKTRTDLKDEFCNLYNTKIRGLRNISNPCSTAFRTTARHFGFKDWPNMLESIINSNHKITSIEYLTETMDTGTLTIDQNEIHHNYHTFAIDAGIYVKNSMLEDIFIAQRCISLDTRIHVVNIGILSLHQVIVNHSQGIKQQVLTVNQDNGLIEAKYINWAGITKLDEPVITFTLENGKTLTCTHDHKLINSDLQEIEAHNLSVGDSLIGKNQSISIIKIEDIGEILNVGCLTVDTTDNNHNFYLESGIFIRNSDGVGSKVETLNSGQSLGELSDLEYLADKVLRGLRVPIAWMKPGANNAVFNDGKLGSAYVEERQFDKYCERLQVYVDSVLDAEFKSFMFSCNINIDHTVFNIKLPRASNYLKYQQAEMDNTLLGMISSADSLPYLSKRFILKNYLQLDETSILENEQLLVQEKGMDKNKDKTLQQLYGAASEADMGMGMGGGLGGMDMGGLGGPGEIGGPGDDTISIGGGGGAPGGELPPIGGAPETPPPAPPAV